MQQKGVKVIAVGVGRNIKKNELIRIAMEKPENVIQVIDFHSLFNKTQEIINSSCLDK